MSVSQPTYPLTTSELVDYLGDYTDAVAASHVQLLNNDGTPFTGKVYIGGTTQPPGMVAGDVWISD